jgi:quinol monooxygenase YgiN
VIATVEIIEGKRDEYLAAFQELVPLVLAEKGCIEYGPFVDIQTAIPI